MVETIKTRLLSDPETVIPMDRKEFYEEQVKTFNKTGKPTRAADIVDILLFNEAGELFVQKRSKHKSHNPRLIDKSLGGHVQSGDSIEFTVMVETVQELQVPSIVLRSDNDFTKAYKLLKNYLDATAIIKHLDTKIFSLKKLINGDNITIANNVHLFIGLYGGGTKTVDREATGVLQYTISDLEEEITQTQEIFTHDLQVFLKEYKSEIEKFTKALK